MSTLQGLSLTWKRFKEKDRMTTSSLIVSRQSYLWTGVLSKVNANAHLIHLGHEDLQVYVQHSKQMSVTGAYIIISTNAFNSLDWFGEFFRTGFFTIQFSAIFVCRKILIRIPVFSKEVGVIWLSWQNEKNNIWTGSSRFSRSLCVQ